MRTVMHRRSETADGLSVDTGYKWVDSCLHFEDVIISCDRSSFPLLWMNSARVILQRSKASASG